MECQTLTDEMLQKTGLAVAPKTPVWFLPYGEMAFVLSSVDEPALDEVALGL